jgi:hypothetical protein
MSESQAAAPAQTCPGMWAGRHLQGRGMLNKGSSTAAGLIRAPPPPLPPVPGRAVVARPGATPPTSSTVAPRASRWAMAALTAAATPASTPSPIVWVIKPRRLPAGGTREGQGGSGRASARAQGPTYKDMACRFGGACFAQAVPKTTPGSPQWAVTLRAARPCACGMKKPPRTCQWLARQLLRCHQPRRKVGHRVAAAGCVQRIVPCTPMWDHPSIAAASAAGIVAVA